MRRRAFLGAIGASLGASLSGCLTSTCTAGYRLSLTQASQTEIVTNAYRSIDELDDPSYRRYVLSQFEDNPTETTYTGFPSDSLRDGELVELGEGFYEVQSTPERRTGTRYKYNITTTDAIPSGTDIQQLSELSAIDQQAVLYNNDVVLQRVNDDPASVNQFFTDNEVTANFEYLDGDISEGMFTGDAPFYIQLGDYIFALTAPTAEETSFSIVSATLQRVAETPSEAETHALERQGIRLNEDELTPSDEAVLDRAVGRREVTVCEEAENDEDVSDQQLSDATRSRLSNRTNRYVNYKGAWYRLVYEDSLGR